MQSPRDNREWMKNVERKLKQNSQAARQLVEKSPGGTTENIDNIIEANKQITPAAPVELSVETAIYLSDEGRQEGTITMTFPPVTKAATGQDILIDRYELWGQDLAPHPLKNTALPYPDLTAPGLSYPGQPEPPEADAAPVWVLLGTSPEPDILAAGLAVRSHWNVKARAIGKYTVSPGLWSEEVDVTVITDGNAPSQPTKPIVKVKLGAMTISWDRMSVDGPMPSDFKTLLVAHGTAPSPETIIAELNNSMTMFGFADAKYYEPQFFRFRAVDLSGNLSPWSEQEVGVAVPLVDTSEMIEIIRQGNVELEQAKFELENDLVSAQAEMELKLEQSNDAVNVALQEVDAKAVAAEGKADDANTAAGDAQTAADAAKADALAAAGIANGKGKVLVQPTAPGADDRNANTLWIDTTGGLNTPKRWVSGTEWQAVTDKVATDAAAAVIVAKNRADEAFDNAVSAAVAAGNALTAANSKGRNWYQPTAPAGTGHSVNDTWFKEPENLIHRWNGTEWVSIQDTDIKAAADAAAEAEAAGTAAAAAAVVAQQKADQAVIDVAAAQVKITEAEGDIAQAQADVLAAQAKADGAASAAQTADAKAVAAQTKANTAQSEVDAAETRITTAEGSLATAKTDITKAKSDIILASDAATVADAKAVAAQTKANTAQSEVDALEGRVVTTEGSISTLTTSVSGKTSIINADTDPVGSTAGRVDGDRWQKWDTLGPSGKLLASWRFISGVWRAEAMDATYLPLVDIGQGTFGSLAGDRLKVGSVMADRVIIGGSANALPDPSFQSAAINGLRMALSAGGAAGWNYVPGTTTTLGKYERTTATNNDAFSYSTTSLAVANQGSAIQVVGGQQWVMSVDIETAISAGVRFNVYRWKADGTSDYTGLSPFNIGVGRRTLTYSYLIPEGITAIAVLLACNTASVKWGIYGNGVVALKASGVMIEDGAITAEKVLAKSITANEIKAASLTSASGIFGTIDASVINSGLINADRLNANDIRAKFISVGKITALELAADSVTASQIAANAVTAVAILAKSITANEIKAATLTSASGIFGTMDANVINAGTLSADRIGAKSIEANKIIIGGANLISNSNFDNGGSGWEGVGVSFSNVSGIGNAGSLLQAASGVQAGSFYALGDATLRPRIVPGQAYRVSAWVKPGIAAPVSSLTIYVRFYDDNNPSAMLINTPISNSAILPANVYSPLSGMVTAPEGATTLVVGLYVQSTLNATVRWSSPAAVTATDGSLVVAGSITAGSLATDSVTAAAIKAGSITATEIAAKTITAAEIKAASLTSASGIFGVIDASVINSGTINALRLNANDIRTKFLAAGKITAADMVTGTITATSGIIGSLDAAVIVAKSITGDKLAVNTVSAENLLVGDFTNLVPNGLGDLGANVGWADRLILDSTDKPAGVVNAFRSTPGQGTFVTTPLQWSVEPDAEYIFEFWIKADKPNSRLFIGLRNEAGAHGTTNVALEPSFTAGVYPLNSSIVPTVWTRYRTVATTNSDTFKLRIGSLYFNHANGAERTATVWIAGLTMKRRSGGELIVDGTITANKLIIGGGSNLLPDPSGAIPENAARIIAQSDADVSDATWWSATEGNIRGWYHNPSAAANIATVDTRLRLTNNSPTSHSYSVGLTPGMTYRISVGAAKSGAGLAKVTPVLQLRRDDGTATAAAFTALDIGAVTPLTWSWVCPDNVTALDFELVTIKGATATLVRYHSISMVAMTTTSLIVDGSIIASSIATNAVTADKILAGAIVAGKIATNAVTSNTIVANAITTAKINALAVTAAEIATNTITADKINVGSITAVILTADAITTSMLTANAITSKHTITGATIRTAASGARVQMVGNTLESYDSSNVLQVRVGSTATGLEVKNPINGAMTPLAAHVFGVAVKDNPGPFGPLTSSGGGNTGWVEFGLTRIPVTTTTGRVMLSCSAKLTLLANGEGNGYKGLYRVQAALFTAASGGSAFGGNSVQILVNGPRDTMPLGNGKVDTVSLSAVLTGDPGTYWIATHFYLQSGAGTYGAANLNIEDVVTVATPL